MMPSKCLRWLPLAAVLAVGVQANGQSPVVPSSLVPAGFIDSCGTINSSGGCEIDCCDKKYRSECCPHHRGCAVCVSTAEKVTEEESCWKVECEQVCVPRVVLPWAKGGSGLTIFNWLKGRTSACGDSLEGCCDRGDNCACLAGRCGDVRCVQVLSSESYEVTRCECKWDVKNNCYRCGCGKRCGRGNGGDACGAGVSARPQPLAPPVRRAATGMAEAGR